MALLQVRDFPAELYENLTEAAHLENRSIAQQTVYILKKELNSDDLRKRKRHKALKASAENPLILPEEARSPEELIREDRDR